MHIKRKARILWAVRMPTSGLEIVMSQSANPTATSTSRPTLAGLGEAEL